MQCRGSFSTFLYASWSSKLLECKSSQSSQASSNNRAHAYIAAHVISRTRLSSVLFVLRVWRSTPQRACGGGEPGDEANIATFIGIIRVCTQGIISLFLHSIYCTASFKLISSNVRLHSSSNFTLIYMSLGHKKYIHVSMHIMLWL